MDTIANAYIGEIHSGQGWTYFLLKPHSIYTINVSRFSLLLPSQEENLSLARLRGDTWVSVSG